MERSAHIFDSNESGIDQSAYSINRNKLTYILSTMENGCFRADRATRRFQ